MKKRRFKTMAINKNNVNLQLTISKSDSDKLSLIVADLSQDLGIDLTKSQAISLLIRNYKKAKPTQEPKATKKALNDTYNYQGQLHALKDKLNCSFSDLEAIIGIPKTTLKKYYYGTQQPKEENAQIIKNAIARYGIK